MCTPCRLTDMASAASGAKRRESAARRVSLLKSGCVGKARSVDDEEACAGLRGRPVRRDVVRDLVGRAGREGVDGPTLDFGEEFAFEDEQDVAAGAPVVGQIARGIGDDADPDVAGLNGAPGSDAGDAGMSGFGNGGPVGDAEGHALDLHVLVLRFRGGLA